MEYMNERTESTKLQMTERDTLPLPIGVSDYKELVSDYYYVDKTLMIKFIFNPWSVINYFSNQCFPKAYWQSTGDNSIICQIVSEADSETADNLRRLMQGQTIDSYIDTSVIYPEIKNNPITIYSFLVAAGYLKIVKKEELYDGNSICEIAIPNKEIFYVYEKEILSALSDVIPQSSAIAIRPAIIQQDISKIQEQLQKFLINTISCFDYAHEIFYHGLMLGIWILKIRYSIETDG